jgi:hypothetical protein
MTTAPDPAEEFFRLRAWVEFHFEDLDDFDAWLKTLPKGPARDELHRMRAAAKATANTTGNAALLEDRVKALWLSRTAQDREKEQAPALNEGRKVIRGRSAGGKKTAKANRKAAEQRDMAIRTAALSIIKVHGWTQYAELARLLSTRGHGGVAALRKKLPKLLPKKMLDRH